MSDALRNRIKACIDDPMWADHAEISKQLLREIDAALAKHDQPEPVATTSDTWPIAQLLVKDGKPTATFYTPGLPDGYHDVWPCPVVFDDEPVAFQWRRRCDPWTLEQTFNSEVFATTDDSEVRPLYAAKGVTP